MIRHMFSNLLLLWSLSYDRQKIGCTNASWEQSWNNQNLSTVPMDLDARLRSLDLSNNFIRQLHTLALPYLEQLDLSNNQLDLISEGAFENLARLEQLNLSRNELNNNLGRNSKAFQSLSGLKNLDLSMNGLSNDVVELYLRNKSSLAQLRMTGNVLTRLSHNLFRESKHLRTITIDENLISEIDQGTFEPLSQLETLTLAKNNLARICDFRLYQVKYLNLSRNSVEFFVTQENDELYNLEILDLSYNKLLYFPVVPKFSHLQYLHLQNNMIGSLTSETAMVSEVNSLYREIVRQKTVRKNDLHSNWRRMPLIYIDLSYNHFTSFPLETLSLLLSLETLNFSYNCLQNINWDIRNYSDSGSTRQLFFHSLEHLEMKSNGLVSVSPLFLSALPQIQTLNLQDNSLQPCASTQQGNLNTSCVEFEQLQTLKHLNLEENNIKVLQKNTFQRSSLVSLNLAKNLHMVMHAGALESVRASLQSLIISEINMSSSHLFLPCMPALTELNISNNHLDVLPSSLSCSPLRDFDIKNNNFTTLNQSLIQNLSAHLVNMHISGNHFHCCDSGWLTVLNQTEAKLPDIVQTECFVSDKNFFMTDYLKNPSLHCLAHMNTQEVHFWQMIIIVLFVTVLSLVLIVSTKNLCCAKKSFIV